MKRVLALDAAWVAALGVLLCLTPWTVSSWYGLARGEAWLLFVVLGLASFGYSGFLLYGLRGGSALAICRFGAIANAVSVPVVLLFNLVPGVQPPARVLFVLVALLCAGFAVAEWSRLVEGAPTKPAEPS